MGGGRERITDLADLVPNRRDRKRVIPGLRSYISHSLGLQTDSTFGNESNQMPRELESNKSAPIMTNISVVNDGSKLTVAQLVASVQRK